MAEHRIPGSLTQADGPLRRSVRRLRWFIASFRAHIDGVTEATGVPFEIDELRLTRAFVAWLRGFDAHKPGMAEDRRPYVGYASGLMLKHLIAEDPLRANGSPMQAQGPARYWAEGYAYVSYCLAVRGAVLLQDFNEDQQTAPILTEEPTWWSFRENVKEDPGLAVAFLDLFAGDPPDWFMPDNFYAYRRRFHETAQTALARGDSAHRPQLRG